MTCYDGYNLDHWDLLPNNNSKIYCNGSEWGTTYAGKCVVVAKLNKYEARYRNGNLQKDWRFYIVKFADGHYNIARISQMRRGTVKNPYEPKVQSIGYIGQGPYEAYADEKDTKEYTIWLRMFQRSYSACYHKKQPTYIGCTVDPRWHNFQNFCEDIQHLEGYAEWKADSLLKGRAKYELDKDIKVKGNKIYSKDTCKFVTKQENNQESNNRNLNNYLTGKTYIAHRLSDGYEEEFINKNAFIRKQGFKTNKIEEVIRGKYKQHKGWTFKVKEDVDGVS